MKNVDLKSTMFRTEPFVDRPGPLLMGRLTTRLTTYSEIGDDIQLYPKYDLSGELIMILITT